MTKNIAVIGYNKGKANIQAKTVFINLGGNKGLKGEYIIWLVT